LNVLGKENNMDASENPVRLRTLLGRDSALGRGIEAAQAWGPTDEQLKALERGVLAGIGAGAATVAAVAATHGTKSATWLSWSTTKLVLALIAAASAGGALTVAWQASRKPSPDRSMAPAARLDKAPQEIAPAVAVPPATSPVLAPAPAARDDEAAAVKGRSPARSNASKSGRGLGTEDSEVTLLGQAHRALASSPALALKLAKEHAGRFPASTLDQERDLIQVTALVDLGRIEEARRLARRFSEQHPGSAYVGRIDRILGRAP
jgi:hypothetical protein